MGTQLRSSIGREEFDYPALMAALSAYANPHQKITSLLRKGTIVRVKKGLYIFGEDHRRRPYSRELLANLIYGPSFVSLDYALAYHGLIPERVEQLTSVTTGRPAQFNTPVGLFVYRPTPATSFHLGMNLVEQGDVSFLMASAERALADTVRENRAVRVASLAHAENLLFHDLRVDETAFVDLDHHSLSLIGESLGSRKVVFCANVLRKLKGRK